MTLTTRNGKLWITFYHQSQRFRRSLNLDDTKANRKLAEKTIIPELQFKLNNGMFFETETKKEKVPTLDEFAEVSFEIHKNERRAFTQQNYIRKYELHIKPSFGTRKVDTIKPSELAAWQNRLMETRSPKTLRNIRTVFQTVLEDALMDDIIKVNPFTRVKAPRKEDVRQKKPFTKKEIFSILAEIPEQMRCFFAIGFFTGMRTGEIIGLKWIDLDWKERILKVRRSRRQGVESKPKTKTSIRDVEVIDALIPYLKKHRELSRPESEYIFETSWQKPFNTTAKIGVWYWRPALSKLGLEYRNLYQMRHTFASMMISHGEDILWVSNMLGHKDSAMTLEKYARYFKRTDKKRATFLTQ